MPEESAPETRHPPALPQIGEDAVAPPVSALDLSALKDGGSRKDHLKASFVTSISREEDSPKIESTGFVPLSRKRSCSQNERAYRWS